jgi:steroid 5-alpha reductase family enzyme
MNAVQALLVVWVGAALLQAAGWLWQRRRRNAGIVDVLWSLSIGAAAVFLAAVGDGAVAPRVALAVLGGGWGLRLAWHLWRRVRAEPEDGRYAQLRGRWGDADGKWFAMFQFQALLAPLFALPFAAVARVPVDGATPWLVAGIAVWGLAVGGEALADAQLARFRHDPRNRGRTCRTGLWRYSRHPNYFFEWLHWFAYVLLAAGSPIAWLAWAGPVVMYVFLRFLSGVPWTEAQALRTRGDDYREYVRTTPMFFPWFPKSPTR